MTSVLALKLLLAPLLVVAASLVGRLWGPRLAGILVTLPLVTGPILLIVYLEQAQEVGGAGGQRGHRRDRAVGLVRRGVCGCVVQVRWVASVLGSWVAVLAADLALVRVELPATAGLRLAVLGLFGANVVLRGAATWASERVALVGPSGPSGRHRSPCVGRDWIGACPRPGLDRCVSALPDRSPAWSAASRPPGMVMQ